MNEVARKHDMVFGIMYNQRTNPLYRKMHGFGSIRESTEKLKGQTGLLQTGIVPQAYYDSGGWRATWAGEGGGVLLNQCPHNLDLLAMDLWYASKVHSFAMRENTMILK